LGPAPTIAPPVARRRSLRSQAPFLFVHVALAAYSLLALFPVLLVSLNSLKSRSAIFSTPYTPPTPSTFDAIGYQTVAQNSNFPIYFLNSFVTTLSTVGLVLFLASLAAFALATYEFRGNTILALFLTMGIMVPIRLGTVSLLRIMVGLGLQDSIVSLIVIYTAQGLPLAIFVLNQFMRQVPSELKDAARIDGASEYRIYRLVLPLVRPALGTVAVFTMVPVWNDLWFPLILLASDRSKTVILGTQVFLGQFVNDWNAVLAALTLAMIPVVVLTIVFSRQIVRGLTTGAVK
ncbi:MAG TPA: carbohydrate ABC transporter permease, partial [Deinococcales bacterium]|nr:carbohydrate ABC transporter permease [Deinococcales bacterium]